MITFPIPLSNLTMTTTHTMTGFGTTLTNIGADNRGSSLYRIYSLTVPDQGFNIVPMFMPVVRIGASGGIAGQDTGTVIGPVTIGAVT